MKYASGIIQRGVTNHAANGNAHAQGGHITILPFNYNSVGQGTWTLAVDGSAVLQLTLYNAETDADNLSYKVYLPAGTWTLRMLFRRGTNMGIVDTDIDGVEVASFDTYAAAGDYNVLNTQTGIVVASSGLKTLRVRVDGKNASSTSFYCFLISIALWRTV